jgi:hypothetical protein
VFCPDDLLDVEMQVPPSPAPPLHRIGDCDPILIIKGGPLEQILSGEKDIEVRGAPLHKYVGSTLWLAQSGKSAVYGQVRLRGCIGPMTVEEWEVSRGRHCVEGPRMYGERTFGWEMGEVFRLPTPVHIRRNSSVVIQLGSGLVNDGL